MLFLRNFLKYGNPNQKTFLSSFIKVSHNTEDTLLPIYHSTNSTNILSSRRGSKKKKRLFIHSNQIKLHQKPSPMNPSFNYRISSHTKYNSSLHNVFLSQGFGKLLKLLKNHNSWISSSSWDRLTWYHHRKKKCFCFLFSSNISYAMGLTNLTSCSAKLENMNFIWGH